MDCGPGESTREECIQVLCPPPPAEIRCARPVPVGAVMFDVGNTKNEDECSFINVEKREGGRGWMDGGRTTREQQHQHTCLHRLVPVYDASRHSNCRHLHTAHTIGLELPFS